MAGSPGIKRISRKAKTISRKATKIACASRRNTGCLSRRSILVAAAGANVTAAAAKPPRNAAILGVTEEERGERGRLLSDHPERVWPVWPPRSLLTSGCSGRDALWLPRFLLLRFLLLAVLLLTRHSSLAAVRLAACIDREPRTSVYCSTSARGTTMKCEAPVTVLTAF